MTHMVFGEVGRYFARRNADAFGATTKAKSPPWAIASEKAMTFASLVSTGGLGSIAPMQFPVSTTITCLTLVLPIISASVGEAPLKITMISAPASLSCAQARVA
jgi:hypothetical protein